MIRTRRSAALTLIAILWSVAVVPAVAHQNKQKAAVTSAQDTGSIVVATVNGGKITRKEVADRLIADQTAQMGVTDPELLPASRSRPVAASVGALIMNKMQSNGGKPTTVTRAEVVDWLFKDNQPIIGQTVELIISERAIMDAAKKRGIVLTKAERAEKWAEAIKSAKEARRKQDMPDAKFLTSIGYREDSVRRALDTQILIEKIMKSDMAKKNGHDLGPSDFIDASHILVRVQVNNPANKEETEKSFAEGLKKIQGIADDIKSGKLTFEAAAQQHSDDQTKLQKGALGIFLRGQMVPEFDKAVFELEQGKVSEPVRSIYGWHLIKVNRLGKDLTGPERASVVKSYISQNARARAMSLQGESKITNTIKPPPGPTTNIRPGR